MRSNTSDTPTSVISSSIQHTQNIFHWEYSVFRCQNNLPVSKIGLIKSSCKQVHAILCQNLSHTRLCVHRRIVVMKQSFSMFAYIVSFTSLPNCRAKYYINSLESRNNFPLGNSFDIDETNQCRANFTLHLTHMLGCGNLKCFH